MNFPHSSGGKESACNAGDLGSIPGLGRSPGEGNGNPLQYSCLENPMGRGAWWATVHGLTRVGHDLATKGLMHVGFGLTLFLTNYTAVVPFPNNSTFGASYLNIQSWLPHHMYI